MKISTLLLGSVFTACLLAAPQISFAQADSTEKRVAHIPAPQPRIQIALLLDTSSSMDGLISQAKSQLWTLVNELAEGKKSGQEPLIELALYEYGNSSISVSKGYIRQVLSLTNDLDDVSEKLFALSTNGGQEYAGQVIMTSLEDLEWSKNKDDMKLIIIAGNEKFTQGPISYEDACARAKKGGVIIDTIHCGDTQEGIDGKWKAGAECAGGIYMTINQDEKYVHIPSPYDDDILKLNKKLNKTYMGYGVKGFAHKERQVTQDSNAASVGTGIVLKRAKSKASAAYSNESWDIVDAYKKDQDKILEMDDAELPEELKGKNADERKVYIEAKQGERADIQKQIADLSKKQRIFVDEKRKDMEATQTLDNIMVTAVRKQAGENGFKY